MSSMFLDIASIDIFLFPQENIWRYQDEFEDTKAMVRIRKSNTDRQHYGQKKKHKRTINNP